MPGSKGVDREAMDIGIILNTGERQKMMVRGPRRCCHEQTHGTNRCLEYLTIWRNNLDRMDLINRRNT